MSETPDTKSCGCADGGGPLPSPFCSLHYHFGMLLGVADLETEQAYHRGKMWLHNGWLHRAGVVWGYGVAADPAHGEIRVRPGLALDALGRELHLENDACLDVAAWFADRRKKAPADAAWFTEDAITGAITFDAHVVIRFRSCLTRQVPALSEPCENAGTATAYSRRCETVDILFRPGRFPDPFSGGAVPAGPPYRRLRLYFGLDAPRRDGAGVIEPEDLAILLAPRSVETFRRLAALDGIDLQPPTGDDFVVVLADVTGVTLAKDGDGWKFTAAEVHPEVRPAHVATAAMQEWIGGPASAPPGVLVLPGSVTVDETQNRIVLVASGDLAARSVAAAAVELTGFDPATGWAPIAFDPPTLGGDQRTLTVSFPAGVPAGVRLLRLVIHARGSAPLLAADLTPFNRGEDFIHDHRRN